MILGPSKIITMPLLATVLLTGLNGCSLFQIELELDENYKENTAVNAKPPRHALPIQTATASPTSDSEAVVTLLRYSRFITELSEDDLNHEFAKIDEANKIEQTNRGMLKLAVLLSLPKARFYDENRAQKILNQFVEGGNSNTPALREYAHMLLSYLRQREDHLKLYDDLHQKLQNEREQRKKLQHKLEELKSIEKSITKRQKEAGE